MVIIVLSLISMLTGINFTTLEYDGECVFAGSKGHGVFKIDPEREIYEKIPDEYLTCSYISSLEIADGNLWIGTYNGVSVLDSELNLILTYIPSDYYQRWFRDIAYFKGGVFLGTLTSVFNYVRTFNIANNSLKNLSVFFTDDSLWVGTDDGVYYSDNGFSFCKLLVPGNFSENHLPVTALVRDNGWFWIGLDDISPGYSPGGLLLYDGFDKVYRIDNNSGLVYNGISALEIVGDFILVASFKNIQGFKLGGGLQKIEGGNITNIFFCDDLFPLINDILYIEKRNEIWVATTNGVYEIFDELNP